MKKIICMLTAFILVFAFAACGNKDQKPTETSSASSGDTAAGHKSDSTQDTTVNAEDNQETTAPAQEQNPYLFHYNDLEIAINADAAPILKALGEPKSYTEQTSCAFEGLDKTYFYGGFYLQTYPADSKDYVYCLWFADDSVATDEGIRIGSSQADVEKAYGADAYRDNGSFVSQKGNTLLTVIMKDGIVSSVQYQLMDI